jgi:glycosyltransferase involved in cell wall biosynthesis
VSPDRLQGTLPRTTVLHVVSNSPSGTFYRLIAEYHQRAQFDVRVATLSPRGRLHADFESHGLSTVAFDAEHRRDFPRTLWRLIRYLKAHRVDVVHTHLFEACVVGSVAARAAGVPLTIMSAHHTNDLVLHRHAGMGRWSSAIDRFVAGHLVDHVIAPSGYTRKALVAEEHVPADRVEVVAYGFDLDLFRPDPVARSRVRAELLVDDDEVLFGAVGRLHWVKNYPVMLNAFARIASTHDRCRLVIVGEGPEEEVLRRLVTSLNLDSRVTLLGQRSDVPDILAAMDVFVHTSRTESFNQALVEAMATRLPVVTTSVGIADSHVRSGANGAVARGFDEDAVADALRAIMADRPSWAQMGSRNRDTAAQFLGPRMVRGFEDCYERWLDAIRRGTSHRTPQGTGEL